MTSAAWFFGICAVWLLAIAVMAATFRQMDRNVRH